MAENDANNGKPAKRPFRDVLAWIVFLVAGGGIIILAGVVIYLNSADKVQVYNVFTTVLPVLSTWVGTILAFYFARENFEAAQASIDRAYSQASTTGEDRASRSVQEVMTKVADFKGVVRLSDKPLIELKLDTLQNSFLIDKVVTRVPIIDEKGAIYCVVHQSTLDKFKSDYADKAIAFDAKAIPLGDFLENPVVKPLVFLFTTVASTATLEEAQKSLVGLKGANDVFVTKTGKPKEPVEGWLTNTTIAREIKVS